MRYCCNDDEYQFLKKRFLKMISSFRLLNTIDLEMRRIIIRVNRNYPFIVPVWSCAGHPETNGGSGYLCFVVSELMTENENKALRMLLNRIKHRPNRLDLEFQSLISLNNVHVFYNAIIVRSSCLKNQKDKRDWLQRLYNIFGY